MRFISQYTHYFKGHISRAFLSLYLGRIILRVATGMLGIFLPIFIYRIFDYDIIKTFLYYGIASLLYFFIVPLGAKAVTNIGFRRSLQISVLFGASFYAVFYFINKVDKGNMAYLIVLSLILLVLYRFLYWLPFHTDFAKFTSRRNRGKEVGILMAASDIIGVSLPVVAGFLISRFGFDILFLLGIVVFLLSVLPYLNLPRTREKFVWSYADTWRQLLKKGNRSSVAAFFADGVETTVAIVVWPIFIFQVLKGDFMEVGLVSTFIIGTTVTLELVIGKFLDQTKGKGSVMTIGTAMYALGWVFKAFVFSAFHIFLAGSYHNLVKVFTREPFDTLMYEAAADQGHYVDEYTVLHEVAIHMGRVAGLAVFIVFAFYLSIQWIFFIAAASTLFLNLIRSDRNMALTRDARRAAAKAH